MSVCTVHTVCANCTYTMFTVLGLVVQFEYERNNTEEITLKTKINDDRM